MAEEENNRVWIGIFAAIACFGVVAILMGVIEDNEHSSGNLDIGTRNICWTFVLLFVGCIFYIFWAAGNPDDN